MVRSVYRAYLDVCQKFELLQRKYDTEVPYLKEQLAEVRGEKLNCRRPPEIITGCAGPMGRSG